jgi:DNA primase
VVALVAAGFPAAVAPLGTAMTDTQLGLLWAMTDEPVLLFDGDRAGRKAAYRMVDIGLAKLSAGKSLRFGLLPEGQDPDDLIRAAGPAAMQDVLSTTVGLADMLWRRETEGQSFDTPEKRAALETRLREVVRAVPAETVRRHYEDDVQRRLREAFAGSAGGRPARGPRQAGGGRPGGGFRPGFRDARDLPLPPAGAALVESALVRGPRAAVPRGEALILELLLNHPWLVAERQEEIAELDLRHPEAARLVAALPSLVDADATLTRADLEEALAAQGHGALLARITGPLGAAGRAPQGAAVHTRSVWGAGRDAAPDDVRQTFHQMVTLHRSRSTLLNELKEAEKALAEAGDEAAFGWLVDVKNRLAVVEGTEALVDGFGAASGRRNERG